MILVVVLISVRNLRSSYSFFQIIYTLQSLHSFSISISTLFLNGVKLYL